MSEISVNKTEFTSKIHIKRTERIGVLRHLRDNGYCLKKRKSLN